MSDIQPVLYIENTGGSGRGIGFYSEAALCGRRANLNAELSDESGEAASTGITFHKLAEMYHRGDSIPGVVLPYANFSADAVQEGLRLFGAYRQRYARDFLGEVIDTEILLPEGGLEASPTLQEQVLAAVGVWPFTARIDMAVRRTTQGKIGDYVLEPGVYLVDHKTKKRKDPDAETTYRFSPQMLAYQLLWNALRPKEKCSGFIINVVVAHKKLDGDSFQQFFIPPPTEDEVAGFKHWLQDAALKAQLNQANLARCSLGYGLCPHLLTGACTRR